MCLFDVEVINDIQRNGSFELLGRDASGGNAFTFGTDGKVAWDQDNATTSVPIYVKSWSGDSPIDRVSGVVSWDFGDRKAIVAIMLEAYWIFGTPLAMWSPSPPSPGSRPLPTGVWLQALRDLFEAALPQLKAELSVSKFGSEADRVAFAMDTTVRLVVNNCMTGFMNGKYKKTYQQGPDWITGVFGKSSFLLWNYCHDLQQDGLPRHTSKCTDQAFLVEIMLGALGVAAGSANFKIPQILLGQLVQRWVEVIPGVPVNPSDNNSFFGHVTATYLARGGTILDACFGPALGTQSPDQYIRDMFDPKATVTLNGTSDGPAGTNSVCCFKIAAQLASV